MLLDPKQIEWLLAETLLERDDDHIDIHDECQYDQDLCPGGLLNRLAILHFANFPRTVLRLLSVDPGVGHATQADAEDSFEEEEDQTDQADKAGDRAIRVDHHHQDKHGEGQDDPDNPCEQLLFGADIFGRLPPDDQPADDQGGGEPGADHYPDQDICQEDDDGKFEGNEISLVQHLQNGSIHHQEQDACPCPNFTLI